MRAFLLILAARLNSVKRLSAAGWIAIVVAAGASARAVDLAWRRAESSETGSAKWIWATDDVKSERPAKFVAVRRFEIGEPVPSGRAKVFVDRAYRFYLDGRLVGSGSMKPGDPADVFDLPGGLQRGAHEVAIEAESPSGIGGILFALDLAGAGRNAVVSDASWEVGGQPVFVWGEPPMYPWGFPTLRRR